MVGCPQDPFAVGQSVITFSARSSASSMTSFDPINETSVILRSSNSSLPPDNFGVEDPRLSFDPNTNTHFLLYSAVESNATAVTSRLALATATTQPNRASGWTRHGALFPALGWSKSGAMLVRAAPPHYLFFGDSSLVPGLQWAS